MNTQFADTLSLLEAELAALDTRRPLIVAGVEALRTLIDTGYRPTAMAVAPPSLVEDRPAREVAQPAARVPKTAAPLTTGAGGVVTDDELVEAIRVRGPIAPRQLAVALDLAFDSVRVRLAALLKAGRVTAEGATTNRVYRGVAASPAPAPPVVVSSDPAIVEARDRALLARLAESDATFGALLWAMPPEGLSADERTSALKSALRRLTLKRQVIDIGAKFRLVK